MRRLACRRLDILPMPLRPCTEARTRCGNPDLGSGHWGALQATLVLVACMADRVWRELPGRHTRQAGRLAVPFF